MPRDARLTCSRPIDFSRLLYFVPFYSLEQLGHEEGEKTSGSAFPKRNALGRCSFGARTCANDRSSDLMRAAIRVRSE